MCQLSWAELFHAEVRERGSLKADSESLVETPRKGAQRRPEHNRRVLIEATLESIVESGITETTVSRIIDKAGLSRGMIQLHFGGKDKLLVAAAEAFAAAYYEELERQIAGTEGDAEALIMAMVRADLSAAQLNPRTVRIWHGFRGVAGTNAEIAQFSNTRDRRLHGMIRDAFSEIAAREQAADAKTLARDATYGTLALLEGMWTDYLLNEERFSRRAAARIVFRFLTGLFPGHFGGAGAAS